MKHKVELLAPAGDLTRLKIAILYGADAVFCGGKQLSLRAKANNFTLDDLKEAVIFANSHHAKVHVTVNIVPTDNDLAKVDEYLLALDNIKVHAIIVSSVYIMKRAKELNCHFEVHVSTQQSITNSLAASFFKEKLHVERVVLARECNINQIQKIKENSHVALETFIHGGMCSSYSGRCGLSNIMVDRDANKGGCAHSCRWNYHLYNKNQLVSNNKCIIASCDLMSVDYVPILLQNKIDSFKIEGRMKSIHYIATIVSAYRRLIDEYYQNHNLSKKRLNYYKSEISKAENRITYTGFYNPKIKHEALLNNINSENPTQAFIGLVLTKTNKKYETLIEVRNNFKKGIYVECFMPSGTTKTLKILDIIDKGNNHLEVASHPKEILKIKVKAILPKNTIIRKKSPN